MERFKNGSKVCFIGDSLTMQNWTFRYIVDFYNKNFLEHNIEFINCGTAGGTAAYALASLEDEVFIHNPDYAVVAFGVNDSLRWALAEEPGEQRYNTLVNAFCVYKEKLTALCDSIIGRGIKLILCTPAPYAEYQKCAENPFKGGFALMQGYADFVKELATVKNISLCDYHSFMTKAIQTEDLYNPDCVHPTPHGYFKMAECFLAFQGLQLGDEYDLPDYFDEWAEALQKLRCLSCAECMIIVDYNLPIEEKIAKLERYIASDKPKMPWFVELSKDYIKYHGKKAEWTQKVHQIYINNVLHKK